MKRAVIAGVLGIALVSASRAQGQTAAIIRDRQDDASAGAAPVALSGPNSLLGHFGVDAAVRLMRSPDADDRLRGLERAAGTRTAGSLALLERAAHPGGPAGVDPRLPDEGIARRDPRALLAVVHGLASWTDNDGARAALTEILRAPNEALAPRGGASPARDDADGAERVTLARQEAAIALAGSGNPGALEALVASARSGGPEQEAALMALTLHPPSQPVVLGGVALTTPATIAMAASIGDLRVLDAILGVMRASDPALRAAALEALGAAGDTRVADVARGALRDEDARVRVAAAEALARIANPGAAQAVEALIAEDATALEGLRIALNVQGEGITRAAAARAAVSANPVLRSAAIATLGRQTTPLAVHALVALAATPLLQGDAMGALARSPSAAAIDALLEMAGAGEPAPALATSRRLAARAYFVRRFVRGERSRPLDALLQSLAASRDPRDRAVGMQALVALGERSVDAALSDPDARVRRAGAMGALGHWDASTARRLAARATVEPDETTRHVLAVSWTTASISDTVPTPVLVERASAGGADAPAAAFALGRRADEPLDAEVEALLGSRDPVLRAQVARGLGAGRAADAVGRLSRAYAWEADASVRRALVEALALRVASGAPGAPAAREGVLELAARLDPDRMTRSAASRAIGPTPAASLPTFAEYGRGKDIREVAWIRLVPAEGAAPALDRTASLTASDGDALPIVFDDEGYALVPGVSPGEARLRLAPDSPSVTAPASP
ncbi:MAG TPA: HEAT repeat domain-containing protein [Polyangiaceae bacterium]|nr:HEAT repeat domain-containing protein [Polyangiaceae bacterium]